MGSKHNIYVDIARYDEDTNTAYGYATTEAIDSYGTVIDLNSVKKCLPEYMRFANIREMHDLKAAGTTEEATVDDKGLYIAAKVVDPTAQLKCKEKVYKGFSIGAKKDYEKDSRIFLKEITEISLVDRPSNPECVIDAYRIFGEENSMDTEVKTSEPEIKRYAGEEICDSKTALSALETITWLMNWEQSEADNGAHPEAEEQVTALKTAIEALKKFVVSELKENTTVGTWTPGEMSIMELAAGADNEVLRFAVCSPEGADLSDGQIDRIKTAVNTPVDITRAGSRHSAEDMERLNTIRDCLRDMGVTMCDRCAEAGKVEKAAGEDDDVQRLAVLEDDVKRLSGENETLKGEKEALVQRVVELEAQPEPAKGKLLVVDKEDDTAGVKRLEEEAEVKRIESLPPEQAALELVKRAQMSPQIIRVR
jgi:hypothetical protein